MDPVLSVGFRHAKLVLAIAGAAAALALPAALNVRVDVSPELLAPAKSALRLSLDEVREDFGVARVAAVFAADPDLFTPEKLRRLEGIGEELAALPSVRRVESLFTVVDVLGADGGREAGALRIAPPLKDLPDDPVALARRREQVLSNPLFVGNLVSAEGDALLLVLHLEEETGARVSAEIEEVLEPHAGELEALHAVGGPIVDRWILDRLRADQAVLLPVVVVVILAVLALALGSLVAAAVPVLAALVTTVIALGILQVLGIPLNLFSAMLPVLVLVVGATEDVYVIDRFRARAREAGDPDAAMALASRDVARAILLAAGTTLLGFAAVLVSDLPILRGFGFAALVGLSLRSAVSLLFVPACLSVALRRITGGSPSATPLERVSRTVSRHVAVRFVARPGPVVVGVVLLAGGCVLLATRIDLSNDAAGLLDPDAEPVARARRVEETISGLSTLHLVLAGEPGTFERQEVLAKVDALARRLRGVEGVGSVVSLPDALRRAVLGLRGGAAEAGSARADPGDFDAVLASDAAVAQLLLFVDPGDLRPLLTPNAARTRLALRVTFDGDEELRSLVSACERHAAEAAPALGCTLTGAPLITSAAATSIVRAQVVSLGGMIAVLFAVVSLLFLSWKCGAMTVAVNLLSVLVLFGTMGALGVPLNVGTCMVAAVTLGMAIDDTLHLLVRFNREVRRLGDERAGIHAGLESALAPIVATSLALISGFGVLALSSFVPVRQFGLLSAWVLAFALFVDVLVTPVLLGTVRMVTLWDVLGLEVRTALLERSDFFRGLSGWQARRVILATDLQEHPAGEPILRAGETGSRMYVVVQGSVEVSVETDGRPRALARLGPGEVFGEAGFASDVERTADVRTLEPSKLLALDPDSLAALRRFSPYLAATLLANVSRILGRRLSSTMEAVRQGDGDELPSRDLPPTSQVRPRRPGKRPRTE